MAKLNPIALYISLQQKANTKIAQTRKPTLQTLKIEQRNCLNGDGLISLEKCERYEEKNLVKREKMSELVKTEGSW